MGGGLWLQEKIEINEFNSSRKHSEFVFLQR